MRAKVFNILMWQLTRIWFGLVCLFVAARCYYLIFYRNVLTAERYATFDLPLAMISAVRFDSVVATHLVLPCLLIVLVAFVFSPILKGDRWLWRVQRFVQTLALILGFGVWAMAVADHFFYIYFRDHFNVFFWEFWENSANASLVIGGLGDSVPLWQVVLSVLAGWLAVLWFGLKYFQPQSEVPGFLKRWLSGPLWRVILVWVLAMMVSGRATFEARPLVLQAKHKALSSSNFINLLHGNFFISMYLGYADRVDVIAGQGQVGLIESTLAADFAALEQFIPGAKAREVAASSSSSSDRAPPGYRYLEQALDPIGFKYLKKRPRHVVVFFMESYSAWVMEHAEEGFNQALAANMLRLKSAGISLEHHFSSGGGTMKNFANAVMSFPQPRSFSPSVNYHKEGHKLFPSTLTREMQLQGYRPEFFYGGEINWHRLYQFLPVLGFRDYYAEHSFDHFEHHKYGIFDRDLFQAVHQKLLVATDPTFIFSLSISNHPPFNVPVAFNNHDVKIPASLEKRLVDSREQFYRRINGFRYADWALGQFFEEAARSPYFEDTLFVITADHPFGGSLSYPSEMGWMEESIPFIFYGPGVLKEEWAGKSLKPFTTHLDLMPTLVALVTEKQRRVHTFGKNMFADQSPEKTGINFYFSCLEGLCLKGNRLMRLTADYRTESLPDDALKTEVTNRINRIEHSYYNAALQYLYRYTP